MRWMKSSLVITNADRSQYKDLRDKEYAELEEKGQTGERYNPDWLAHKRASRKVIKDFADLHEIEIEKIRFLESGWRSHTWIYFNLKGKDADVDTLTKELLDLVPQIDEITFRNAGVEDETILKRDLYSSD